MKPEEKLKLVNELLDSELLRLWLLKSLDEMESVYPPIPIAEFEEDKGFYTLAPFGVATLHTGENVMCYCSHITHKDKRFEPNLPFDKVAYWRPLF